MGGGVLVIMHGGSRRVGPSNEAATGRGDEKMAWTKGRTEEVLLPLLLLCVLLHCC